LFAKKNGGKIIFRFEDTDRERSKKEFGEDILESLKWMGITYDEGPFRQSDRTEVYKKYIKMMLDSGHAYLSTGEGDTEFAIFDPQKLTTKALTKNRDSVIRFKNPKKKIIFNDLIRGPVEFDTEELGDFVIAKSIDEPIYHLAVVVDDFDMGITHIIRGDDGISNTPRQILIQEAIGAPRPQYAHVPLILAPDRSKLSGRHGAVSIRDYRKMGYLPEALVNYLALLGWNPGTEQEIFNMNELIEAFDISKIQKGGAIFNTE
jgi:glutamyl/glutaminyl-tRNA synthetase